MDAIKNEIKNKINVLVAELRDMQSDLIKNRVNSQPIEIARRIQTIEHVIEELKDIEP